MLPTDYEITKLNVNYSKYYGEKHNGNITVLNFKQKCKLGEIQKITTDISKELIVTVAGYIKQRNYKRSDYKKISKKIMSDEEADAVFDNVDMTLTYDLSDVKKKLDVHVNYKYIEMKRHYEEFGLCKILYPSSYGFLLNGEYNKIDIDIYFGNVNYVDGKKTYNFGKVWARDPELRTCEKIEKINEPINEPIIDPIIENEKHKQMRQKLNAVMSSRFFLDD